MEQIHFGSSTLYELWNLLPVSIDRIHNIFHMSLHKYISGTTHELRIENVELNDSLVYKDSLVQILDRRVKELKNKHIPLIKVLWKVIKSRRPHERSNKILDKGSNSCSNKF